MSWVKIEANSRVAQRMYRGILMGILLAFLTACGSTPLPPSVPPFPPFFDSVCATQVKPTQGQR